MAATETFEQRAVPIMKRLMIDFDLTPEQAAGIVGNLAQESGLKAVQEKHPVRGRGGFGWAQWTGPRRDAFEAYCAHTHRDPVSDAANYGYLWRELSGHQPGFDYSHAIEQLKKTTTLISATDTFEAQYEKAGVPALAARRRWAAKALIAYHEAPSAVVGDPDVRRIQQRLADMGHDPGPIDGVWGPRTKAGVLLALGA